MLNQIHHEFRDGRTEMVAQFEQLATPKELGERIKEAQQSHPLPEDAQWLVCNEDNERFVWAVNGENICIGCDRPSVEGLCKNCEKKLGMLDKVFKKQGIELELVSVEGVESEV